MEKGVVIFEFARWNGLQAFALGFADQVFNISPLIVLGNYLMGFAGQAGTKNPVGIAVVFKKLTLNRKI